MTVKQIVVCERNVELEIVGATLLSIEEAEKLPERLIRYKAWWWLR